MLVRDTKIELVAHCYFRTRGVLVPWDSQQCEPSLRVYESHIP
jgi:hypothetical protein